MSFTKALFLLAGMIVLMASCSHKATMHHYGMYVQDTGRHVCYHCVMKGKQQSMKDSIAPGTLIVASSIVRQGPFSVRVLSKATTLHAFQKTQFRRPEFRSYSVKASVKANHRKAGKGPSSFSIFLAVAVFLIDIAFPIILKMSTSTIILSALLPLLGAIALLFVFYLASLGEDFNWVVFLLAYLCIAALYFILEPALAVLLSLSALVWALLVLYLIFSSLG